MEHQHQSCNPAIRALMERRHVYFFSLPAQSGYAFCFFKGEADAGRLQHCNLAVSAQSRKGLGRRKTGNAQHFHAGRNAFDSNPQDRIVDCGT
jgi:hypothetical protein